MAIIYGLGICYYIIAILYTIQEGRKRSIGFIGVGLLVFCLPMIGMFIVESLSNTKAKGCKWCGNKYNEAEHCGLCGKNEQGAVKAGFVPRP